MKLVFATNNLNKLSEIKSLMPDGIEILSLKDINCLETLPETNPTLQENALQKAEYVFDNYGFNCFADDTGLEIDALGGEPGVFSARYAGANCNAVDNINKVLHKLEGQIQRDALFKTVIALIINGEEILFEGVCKGHIKKIKSGVFGFGYDPIFIPTGFDISFGEMEPPKKHSISHRAIAFDKLKKELLDE